MSKEPKFRIGELVQSCKFINGYGLVVDKMIATRPGEGLALDFVSPANTVYYEMLSRYPNEWFYMVVGMHLFFYTTSNQDTVVPLSVQLYLEENIQKANNLMCETL